MLKRLTVGHRVQISAILVACAFLLGCDGLTYIQHLAENQLTIVGNTQPIADVLESDDLSAEEKAKLQLIVAARQFAVETVGLNAGTSYTTYYDTSGDPLAFNLSAAKKHALEPFTWTFPVVGTVPYVAFFDENYLERIEQNLIDRGYDTFSYELDAYSTLGIFEDPVRSTMLKRHELSLADTIIHELLHNTIWKPNDTTYNETLATFVGRQGAIEFLTAEYGADSYWATVARPYYADLDTINAFLATLYDDVSAFYAQDLTNEEKIAGREAIFQAARDRFTADILPTMNFPNSFAGYANLPTNNAWLLGNRRYNYDLGLLEAVYAATGNNWSTAMQLFREAANSTSPFEYLQSWMDAQQ